ncbi:Glycosyltransferase family protein 64 protein C5 [Raphanus sativus]|nr:Glycosyltransferase family protein 64 protein C5 [Raphanus sativus]
MEEMLMPLHKYLDTPTAHDIIHNGATFQIAGLTNNSHLAEAHEVRHCVQKYKNLGEPVLQVAKRRLDSMLYVGLTEEHRESASLFANVVGSRVLSQVVTSNITSKTTKSEASVTIPESGSDKSEIQNGTSEVASGKIEAKSGNMTVKTLMEVYEGCITHLRKSQGTRRVNSLRRISPANFTRTTRARILSEVIEQIKSLNNLDVELFKYAKEIFVKEHELMSKKMVSTTKRSIVDLQNVFGEMDDEKLWKLVSVTLMLLLLFLLFLFVNARRRITSKVKNEKDQKQSPYVISDTHSGSSVRRFMFFASCFILYALVAATYAWLAFPPHVGRTDHVSSSSLGCREDNEGSWSIGVYYGDSPFTLKPIETVNVWRNESAAWPVANPVLTCASLTNSGFPSNFVADPFLYVQGNTLYLFFENKNPITMQGDIGVAESTDKGATWKPLGIALDEAWHLSFPFVFNYNGQIYMMPESSQIGELRLYRAVNFPLIWKLEKVILEKPLVDSTIIHHQGNYYLFGSDHSSFGTKKNGQLEIWYSSTPLGPWKPHKRNPIYNGKRNVGARNGGRPFSHDGSLYRVGQDCGENYGKRIIIFKIEALSMDEYREVQVPFDLEASSRPKGENSWNGLRQHHLVVRRLSSGGYIGLADGDRVASGDLFRRVLLGYASLAGAITLVVLLGFLLGIVNCVVPSTWCMNYYYAGKRTDTVLDLESGGFLSDKLRRLCSRLNRVPSFLRGRSPKLGRLGLGLILLVGVLLSCLGIGYIYGGSGAVAPYTFKGHASKFTLVTMTYDARLWNLKMYVSHYSRCASVKEIVVIWNKGPPPDLTELDSAVPVRIRVEKRNSLNNRFNIDPLIKTRAVLELDDDIMMSCDLIEKGFRVWREHPERLVGFYPRYVDGTMTYGGEKFARSREGYNMILTGAAFMDVGFAFGMYQSDKAKLGREFVDEQFNCEDVLLNFLYANASGSAKAVEYVRPSGLVFDTSKFSGVAISGNTNQHYRKRSECLRRFSELYGSLSDRRWEFGGRKDGWDL